MSVFHSETDTETILRMLEHKGGKIHFVGILGEGMAPLAELMHERGYSVSGSDIRITDSRLRLITMGIQISRAPDTELAARAELVVYTLAVSENDSELLAAGERGIPCVSRAELLGAVMLSYRNRIGVMGTHGKSTTVAMLHRIFSEAKLSPTTLCGAALECGGSLSTGGRDWFIFEACEYRDSFLHFYPTHALVTNIELDHTDYFPNMDELCASFALAVGRASETALLSMDDGNCREIGKGRGRVSFFGSEPQSDYRMCNLATDASGSRFSVEHRAAQLAEVELRVPGEANARDALAAFAMSHAVGISPCIIVSALRRFGGIGRRLEYLGCINGRPVYYDYAHHPTEIFNTATTLGRIYTKVCAIFRPHTYSRTEALFGDLCRALSLFDRTVVLPVYAAREERADRRGSRELAAGVRGGVYASMDEATEIAVSHTEGAIVLLGAGDVECIKSKLLSMM